ncbi:helix-turn-helix domain-containing protein [Methylovirgula sp. HY1]|uniref:helix-turn-helix domain-containing protein n=1 Tax=Methylovirgula sp. HY1 TaxID=2822761 RepID=UPI00351CE89E
MKIVDVGDFCLYQSGMTPAQCRAARGFLDMSQDELAKAASVGISTVRDFEKGRRLPIANNLAAIQAVLEARGIGFLCEEGTSGVTFTMPADRTNRAVDGARK